MTTPSRRIVSIATFERLEYPRIKSILVDGDALPETFDDWCLDLERKAAELRRDAAAIVSPIIAPDKLLEWCRVRGVQPSRDACDQLAFELAQTAPI
ncbi:MAG: hypothetical protein VB141_11235 [Burkholderia gladioli]